DPEEMPEKEARPPRPKIATVERREASASRWTRAAPRQAWTVARHERDNRNSAPFGAPLAPHGVDGKEESKTRAQQRAAGTKKTALFDIVNRNIAATRSVPAERVRSRAPGTATRLAAHISFIAFRLACPSLPTIRWSCTAIPSGRAMSTIAFVISMSAREGDG